VVLCISGGREFQRERNVGARARTAARKIGEMSEPTEPLAVPLDGNLADPLNGAVVLFDVDGTLVDSAPAITHCLARAIESVGLEAPPMEALGADIGPPLEEALSAHGVPGEAMEQAKATYRSCYATEGLERSALYPGVAAMLADLGSAGLRMATATSKRVAMATDVCRHLGILDHFEVIGGADEWGRLHKPQILSWTLDQMGGAPVGRTAMVGDRRFDIEGGTAHGLPSIGVLWGYGTSTELQAAGAFMTVSEPGRLPGALVAVIRDGEPGRVGGSRW
jgi:phosphoglycolate phosphatase